MRYIFKILSKSDSKIRLFFYLPWIGVFIGTIFLLLINGIMDGMENEIFSNLHKIESGHKISSSSKEEIHLIENYLNINKIPFIEKSSRDIVVASKNGYAIAKIIIDESSEYNENISLGYAISKKIHVTTGDSVQIFSPLDVKLTTMSVPNKSFGVSNVYEIPVIDFDDMFIFSNDTIFSKHLNSEKYFLIPQDVGKSFLSELNNLFTFIRIQKWTDEYLPLIDAIKLEKSMYNLFGYLLVVISSLGLFTTSNYTILNKIRSFMIIDLMGRNFNRIRVDAYKLMLTLCSLSTVLAIFCVHISIYFNLFNPLIDLLFPKDLFYNFRLSIEFIDCIKILFINLIVIMFSIYFPLKIIDSSKRVEILRENT